ncbi:hypothetical protein J3459_013577 [Metarhizium acridum]|nr:hypothetical protein J3459_013577 [Metarhizium acridum]
MDLSNRTVFPTKPTHPENMAAVSPEDDEGEGELGDPDSKFTLSELEDTIVVGGHGMRGGQKPADRSNTFEANEDEVMEGASTKSTNSHSALAQHYSIRNN